MEINAAQIDRIGQLADKADNYLHGLTLPVKSEIHIEGCRAGFREIQQEASALYRELGGDE